MSDCIFCKIASSEIPSEKIFENDEILAFRDIAPQAPTHILVIPKRHIESAADLTPADAALIGNIFTLSADIARKERLTSGFRIVTNSGPDACQTEKHLHFHILGGRRLSPQL